jgi:hypothetical protein
MRTHSIFVFVFLLITGRHTFLLLVESLNAGFLFGYIAAIISLSVHCYALLNYGFVIVYPETAEIHLRKKSKKVCYEQLVETGFTPEEALQIISR